MGRLGIGKCTMPLVVAMLFWSGFTHADLIADPPDSDSEIRIGNIMPYTGPLAAFGAIGRAEAAYFDMVNDKGGINGRKVKFISYDDSSNPATAAPTDPKAGRDRQGAADVRIIRDTEQSCDPRLSE